MLDVNDNAPRCPSVLTDIQIELSTVANTSILRFTATDTDLGNNALIRYSLRGLEEEVKFFRINTSSGEIFTTAELPASNMNLRITVNATDDGMPSLSTDCDLAVTLYPLNDTVNLVLQIPLDQFDEDLFEETLTRELGIPIEVAFIIPNEGLVIFPTTYEFTHMFIVNI